MPKNLKHVWKGATAKKNGRVTERKEGMNYPNMQSKVACGGIDGFFTPRIFAALIF